MSSTLRVPLSPVHVRVAAQEDFMSSKRFGKKPKKVKEKAEKDGTEAAPGEKKSAPAPKPAKFAQKHFQRRTSG
jgi:hypothetical protein